jgi:hypothetical protein
VHRRRAAGVELPLPRGSIQAMLTEGPAISTLPLAVGISDMCASVCQPL